MPKAESVAPNFSPQSLARRERRNEGILAAARLTLPGRMVLSCKRELDAVHREAAAPGLDPADRASLVSASVKLRDQLMDLLALPRRPAAREPGKKAHLVLDVSPGSQVPTPPDLEP